LDNGILVDPDSTESFKEAIEKMVRNYPAYKQKAEEFVNDEYFKQFHKNAMLNNYLAFYREIG
jgi:glycosyltransferase involved in cell wall biosynthesis